MSRYFARLAQRSGFAAPSMSSTKAPGDAADIVEQDTYTDGAVAPIAANTNAAAPSALPQPTSAPAIREANAAPSANPFAPASVSTPLSPSTAETKTSRHRIDDIRSTTASLGEAVLPSARAITSSDSISMSAPTVNASAPSRTDMNTERSVPSASSDTSVVRSDNAPAIVERMRRIESGAQATRSTLIEAASPSLPIPASTSNAAMPTASPRPTSITELHNTILEKTEYVHAAAREATAQLTVPETESPTPAAVATTERAERTVSEPKNIEVRIGAVRLEVHAPAPAPLAAPAPATNPANEPPRVALRRYHLRG